MIKGSRNQLGNVANVYQTNKQRILFVCSAGLLRSPTAANVIHKEYGHNTRACGSSKEFALIPISQALIKWADEIVFITHTNLWDLDQEEKEYISEQDKNISILGIPDDYEWNDKELQQLIMQEFPKRFVRVLQDVI
jgi:predicted protein tyrosine phosphatase